MSGVGEMLAKLRANVFPTLSGRTLPRGLNIKLSREEGIDFLRSSGKKTGIKTYIEGNKIVFFEVPEGIDSSTHLLYLMGVHIQSNTIENLFKLHPLSISRWKNKNKIK